MNILMVGCGQMGGAMLKNWAGLEDMSFTVVDPAALHLPFGVRHETAADALADDMFDMLIVAVKPQMIETVMPAYGPHLIEDGCLVSIAAGYSLQGLEALFPGRAVVRVMPNLPALIGRSATGLFANDAATKEHRALVSHLMEAVGTAVWVPSEDQLDRLTAISGSGPGYVFQFIESFIEAAESLGFSHQDARKLVLQTMVGATEMAMSSDRAVGELRQSVTSKGGTTQAGLEQLRTDGTLDRLMVRTTSAAYGRARALR
ncbi:MAG: pyrroline-5-carboxylate reductase [Alphaproteobacteria bacterium]|nr:MAG: pyrroline-5-carboxylate reductase [Alphaproteobacteria bacterium]